MQRHHNNTNFPKIDTDIILLCDGVNSPANIGSLLRIADSFGVQKVLFGAVTIDINSPRLKRTARSAQNWTKIEDNIDVLETLEAYKKKGYTSIALEITDKSDPIQQSNFLNLEKILLIIGDESAGVSNLILENCKLHRHITMFGKNSSMNVSQATSIALYEITKQLTHAK